MKIGVLINQADVVEFKNYIKNGTKPIEKWKWRFNFLQCAHLRSKFTAGVIKKPRVWQKHNVRVFYGGFTNCSSVPQKLPLLHSDSSKKFLKS